MKLFNHGLYPDIMEKKISALMNEKRAESDPYKQWNIQSQISILNEMLVEYKKTVDLQLNG